MGRAATCALLLLLSSGSAVAQTTRAALAVVINEQTVGDAQPLLRGEDVLMPMAPLRRAGVVVSKTGGRLELADGEPVLSLRSLPAPATFRLDERTATIYLQLPAAAFAGHEVDLRAVKRPAGLVVDGGNSGFLNYGVQVREGMATVTGEVGATIGRAFANSTVSWNSQGGWMRGLTRVSFDRPEQQVRVTLGDAIASGGGLGGGAVLGGLHFERRFELDPYATHTPAPAFEESVTTPSMLEVFVNDRLVRSEPLPPGPFRLENLPAPRGEVGARYVLRDAFGRTRELTQHLYVAGGLLRPGETDFGFSLGQVRENAMNEPFRYREGALISRLRFGATTFLTPGLRLELTPEVTSGGGSVAFATPLGEAELAGSMSSDRGMSGWSAAAGWSFSGPGIGASFQLRGTSDRYSTVSLSAAQDRPVLQGALALSVTPTRAFSFGAQGTLGAWRDAGPWHRVLVWSRVRLSDGVALTLTGAGDRALGQATQLEARAELTIVLGPRTSATVRARASAGGAVPSVEVFRSLPHTAGFGYRAMAEAGASPRAEGRVDGQSSLATGSVEGGYWGGRAHFAVQAAGSVVTAGGRVRLSRPVQDGFGFALVPGVPHVPVRVENQWVGDTDESGLVVLPSLLPYYANRISISETALPFDAYSPTTELMRAPRARGAAVIQFPVRRLHLRRGRVVVRRGGEDQVPAFGELRLRAEDGGPELASPIGRGGEFEFEDLPAGRYVLTVDHARLPCANVVAMEDEDPEGAQVLRCRASEEVKQ